MSENPNLAFFTDREPVLKVVRDLIAAPVGHPLPVLTIHGVGGVGKTALLEKLADELDRQDPPLPHARFDVETLGSPALASRDVPLRLRTDLAARFGLSFPRFDLALAVVLAHNGGAPPPLVRVNDDLNDVFQFATALISTPKDGVLGFLDRQIRKFPKAEALVRRMGGTADVEQLRARALRDDPTLADELIDRFVQDLAVGLPTRPGRACRGVLFFDTFEAHWRGHESSRSVQTRQLDAWLRRLAKRAKSAGVLVVVAGRDLLTWADDDPDWSADEIAPHLLGGLSHHDAQIYLSRRGIGPAPWATPSPLQQAILECCDDCDAPGAEPCCHPYFLALCADIVDNDRKKTGAEPAPSTFRGIPNDRTAKQLAERFLRSLPNERWQLWIQELSLTTRFDEKVALALDGERNHYLGRAGWKQLLCYSFVEPQPDGFHRLHKTMRDVLRTRLGDDESAVHAWFRDHWTSVDESSLAWFHRWSLEPGTCLNDWVERHRSALKALRIAEARALLDDWDEVDLDDFDRLQLGDPLWAKTHGTLGVALWETPIWPRAEVLFSAIACFEAALRVYTETDASAAWSTTQNNLGNTYSDLPTGDRGANLDRAIACFEAALRVRTESDTPADWAMTQNNLGNAYFFLPTGDRGANLDRAIACYEAALRVRTESDAPADWSATQHNLGNAYSNLQAGDRGANLRRAIACYEAALRVRTESDAPMDHADTHWNLALVLGDLVGEDDEGLAPIHRAIASWESAAQSYRTVGVEAKAARCEEVARRLRDVLGPDEA